MSINIPTIDSTVQEYIRSIVRDELQNGDYDSEKGDGDGDGDGGSSEIDIDALVEQVAKRVQSEIEHPEQLSEEQVRTWITESTLSEQRVIELIGEHAPKDDDDGSGLTDDQINRVISLLDQLNAEQIGRLDTLLDRIGESVGTIEDHLGLSTTIGPGVPDSPYMHSTPGWGLVFTAKKPIQIGECDIVSNRSGTTNVEIWKYANGNTQGDAPVDTTSIKTASDGEHHVDLDLSVSAGQYLLTRDYATQPDKNMSLGRTTSEYDFDGDSGELVALKKSSHNEYSDSSFWYYYFNLNVATQSDSNSNSNSNSDNDGGGED